MRLLIIFIEDSGTSKIAYLDQIYNGNYFRFNKYVTDNSMWVTMNRNYEFKIRLQDFNGDDPLFPECQVEGTDDENLLNFAECIYQEIFED